MDQQDSRVIMLKRPQPSQLQSSFPLRSSLYVPTLFSPHAPCLALRLPADDKSMVITDKGTCALESVE